MDIFYLGEDPLSVSEVMDKISDPSCGGLGFFVGTTRDNFDGKIVEKLEYEGYVDMAKKEMKKICTKAREKWNIKHIAIYHRLGVVNICEASVIIGVSSVHRQEALNSVAYLIDTLKSCVPIWKREIYADKTGDWKRNKECQWLVQDDDKGEKADNEERGMKISHIQ